MKLTLQNNEIDLWDTESYIDGICDCGYSPLDGRRISADIESRGLTSNNGGTRHVDVMRCYGPWDLARLYMILRKGGDLKEGETWTERDMPDFYHDRPFRPGWVNKSGI